jgi:hypothetical protein
MDWRKAGAVTLRSWMRRRTLVASAQPERVNAVTEQQ